MRGPVAEHEGDYCATVLTCPSFLCSTFYGQPYPLRSGAPWPTTSLRRSSLPLFVLSCVTFNVLLKRETRTFPLTRSLFICASPLCSPVKHNASLCLCLFPSHSTSVYACTISRPGAQQESPRPQLHHVGTTPNTCRCLRNFTTRRPPSVPALHEPASSVPVQTVHPPAPPDPP